MTMNQMTVAVLSLRAMGSAAAATLARRGCRVIGFEQYWRAHNRGASHRDTRAIRKAYVREEQYAPLVLDSYELCRRPERTAAPSYFATSAASLSRRQASEP